MLSDYNRRKLELNNKKAVWPESKIHVTECLVGKKRKFHKNKLYLKNFMIKCG